MSFVAPQNQDLYTVLMHGNFANDPDVAEDTLHKLFTRGPELPEDTLRAWIHDTWRNALCGGWYAGIQKNAALLPDLREELLASRSCFQSQGYCFALARLGTPEAVNALLDYLKEYLPVGDREYDQRWAIGALTWLDNQHSTTHATAFMEPELWDVVHFGRKLGAFDPLEGVQKVRNIMHLVEDYERRSTAKASHAPK